MDSEAGEHASDHLRLALGLNHYARLPLDTGAYLAAEALLGRALGIEEKALGEDSPELITTLENYAIVLRELRRHEEAAALESRADMLRSRLYPAKVDAAAAGSRAGQ
jgi:hypothetical protein